MKTHLLYVLDEAVRIRTTGMCCHFAVIRLKGWFKQRFIGISPREKWISFLVGDSLDWEVHHMKSEGIPTKPVPLFIQRLKIVLDEARSDHSISWSAEGNSLLIFDEKVLEENVLPWLVGSQNYTSFLMELGIYGFYKVLQLPKSGQKRGNAQQHSVGYRHPYFRRDRPDLMWLIRTPSTTKRVSYDGFQYQDVKPFKGPFPNQWKAYETILQATVPKYRTITTQALIWVLYAIRPLHILELLPALRTQVYSTVPASELSLSPSLFDEPFESKLWSSLRGLVEIDADGLVRFTHYSVRDFLLAGASRQQWVLKCRDFQTAQEILVQISVCHLLDSDGLSISLATLTGEWPTCGVQAPHCPFCGYASVYWLDHYRSIEQQSKYLPGFIHRSLLSVAALKDMAIKSEIMLLDYLLSFCARTGVAKLAKVYIEMGADLNGNTLVEGRSPLDLAIAHGHTAVVKMFLQTGSLIDQRSRSHGHTPLMIAALSGNAEVTQDLINHGACVNVLDSLGETPLHSAVVGGSTECVEILLSAGAKTTAKIALTGETPLHLAGQAGYTSMYQLLLLRTFQEFRKRTEESRDEISILLEDADGQLPLYIVTDHDDRMLRWQTLQDYCVGKPQSRRTCLEVPIDRNKSVFTNKIEGVEMQDYFEHWISPPHHEPLCQKMSGLHLGTRISEIASLQEHAAGICEWKLVSNHSALS